MAAYGDGCEPAGLPLSAGGVVEGTPFGHYRLIELLGRGGMGEVWKAFDTVTQRVVAVKVLPSQMAADPVFEQRFRREAFAAASLNDPHVVPIHNFGEIEGRLYVDMRLIEGEDLDDVLKKHGPMHPERAVKITEQIASALNAAHRVGLVHRDVKPSNILLTEDDFAYLIDFGIARGAGEAGLTGTGNVIGTWPYMAPERFTKGHTDTRSDIYALACVLYECLTCSQPFPGESVEQQIAGHLTTPPPRPSIKRPGVSPHLDRVIATGMAKDPDQRYRTTTELAQAARSAATTPIPKPLPPPDPQHTQAGPAALAPTQAHMPQGVREPWAATQQRPAENLHEPSVPRQARPAEDLHEAAPPPEPWWRRRTVVIPVALILIIAAISTILTVLLGGEQPLPPPRGPLDGTFAVEFGAGTNPDGQPEENAPGGQETWVIESTCVDRGCVATASKVSGSQSTVSALVLDKIGGRWVGVNATQGTCQNASTELWETMSLQSRSEGTLEGEYIVRSTSGCARNQQVTFTRTGDAQSKDSLSDPQAQTPRVASPAQGLHGRYQETDKYVNGGRTAVVNFDIQTYCLRTGQRCLSYWLNPVGPKTLLYSQNRWVLTTTSSEAKCESGAPAHHEISLEYPLPESPKDPITLLTGRGHFTSTGECPGSSDFDSQVERTGD